MTSLHTHCALSRRCPAGSSPLRRLVARFLFGLVPALASGTLFAQSLSIEPERPSSCEELVLIATRFTSSDCAWSVRAHAIRAFDQQMEFELELVAGSEICLPVAREETFRVPLGRFPAGEWRFSFAWTDGHAVEPRELTVLVESDEDCGSGFHLADANGDTRLDIADPVASLNFLFLGEELPCEAAADANSSETLEISDAIFTLAFLFSGGPSPMPSPLDCSPVPSDGALACETPSCRPDGSDAAVWIAMPDGCLQCDDCAARKRSADEVADELREEGFEVFDATEGHVAVCEACSCPSGRFWLLLVSSSDAETLRERGWEPWGRSSPR